MALPALDAFTGTDGDSLSANWTTISGSILIHTNRARGALDSWATSISRWNADTFGDDQYAEADINISASDGSVTTMLFCRLDATGDNYYVFQVPGDGSGDATIKRRVGGTTTTLSTSATLTLTAGDTIRLECSGTTITALVNGSTTDCPAAVTDSNVTSGSVGIGFQQNHTSVGALDNFEASNLSGTDTTAPTISNQSFNYNENQTAGATVATVSATDDTAVTSFIFTSTGTQTSSDTFFSITNAGVITITAAGAASDHNDFESGLNFVVHNVTVGDAASNTSTADITLNVLDIDDSAPLVTASTAVIGQTTVTIGATSNEAGTAHAVLYLTSEVTPPTDSEVIDGTYANAVSIPADLVVSAAAFTFPEITGLTGNTGYSFKIIVVDNAGLPGPYISSVLTSSFTTLNATATFSTDAISATLDVVLFDGAVESLPAILKTFNDTTTDGSGNLSLDLNDVSVTASQAVEGIAKDTTSNDPLPIQGTVGIA